jgi:cytochrome oxidase Cu insertion factor (SCO1/SenC/PrrC family)
MENRLSREERGVLGAVVAWFVITAAWWLLALWPVANAPVWLERTRYVCFGVNETGLPDGGGWIGLIAGPLGMLAILVVGWWRSFTSIVHKSKRSFGVAATLAALAAGVILIATGATWRVSEARVDAADLSPASTLPPETYPRLDQAAPALQLVAQTGDIVDLARFAGRPVLVTFAFAHCTTICPVIVKQTLDAQAMLRGSPAYPAVLIVTLDPWRDTPSRLPALAESWQLPAGDAFVLSGAVEQVESVLNAWNIPRSRNESTGDVTHPSLVYVVDNNGRIAFASTGGSENLAALLRRL